MVIAQVIGSASQKQIEDIELIGSPTFTLKRQSTEDMFVTHQPEGISADSKTNTTSTVTNANNTKI